jgi:hypothetical protein
MAQPVASQIPETVQTLSTWRLSNSDKPFDEQEFNEGLEEHFKEADELFDKAFAHLGKA